MADKEVKCYIGYWWAILIT